MTYRVVIQPAATAELEAAYLWIAERAPAGAGRWFNGLFEAILSLARLPRRCPEAPESEAFTQEIRQLLYGPGEHRYRILFTIRKRVVHVLHVRHGAQLPLEQDEIEGAP